VAIGVAAKNGGISARGLGLRLTEEDAGLAERSGRGQDCDAEGNITGQVGENHQG